MSKTKNIRFSILKKILKKTIKDRIFEDLMEKYFVRGYYKETTFRSKKRNLGVFYSGKLSFLLCKIYYKEFDNYIYNYQFKFNQGYRGYQIPLNGQKVNYEIPILRLWYVRFLDNIILGIEGRNDHLVKIVYDINVWLDSFLKARFTNLVIKNVQQRGFEFLYYEIHKFPIRQFFHKQPKFEKREYIVPQTLQLKVPIKDLWYKL